MRNMLYYFLAGLIFLQSCGMSKVASQKGKVSKDHLITCENIGRLNFNYSLSEIEDIFGKENVNTYFSQMDGLFHTFIYEGKPEEIEIEWENSKIAGSKSFVTLKNQYSPYRFKNGIGIGTPLIEINKYNKEPLYFSAFDYEAVTIVGGAPVNSDKLTGKIVKISPCFKAAVANKYRYDGPDDLNKSTKNLTKKGEYSSMEKEAESLFIRSLFFDFKGKMDK